MFVTVVHAQPVLLQKTVTDLKGESHSVVDPNSVVEKVLCIQKVPASLLGIAREGWQMSPAWNLKELLPARVDNTELDGLNGVTQYKAAMFMER